MTNTAESAPLSYREEAMTHDEIVKHMHAVTAGYHQHYSTVRTAATALVMPIGIVASMSFLSFCASAGLSPWFGISLVGFVIAVTLYLNLVFTQWSRIARRCERSYEEELLRLRTPSDGLPLGFRHRFRRLSGRPAWISGPGDAIRLWQWANLRDPFMSGALFFSLLYAAWYVFAAGNACPAG